MPNNFIRLQVKSSGQYLSIQGSSNQNGALAVQGDTPTTNNFLWEIQDPGADGWSLIEVKSSGQFLNILNGGNSNGQSACQGNMPTTTNFKWKQATNQNVPTGWFLLQVESSGQYLNIFNGGNTVGQRACQGNAPYTENFFWQIVTANPKPVTIDLEIDCPNLLNQLPGGGNVSDAIANACLTFGDDNRGRSNNGNQSGFESIVNPGSKVTWTASTKSGNSSSYDVSIDQISYEPGSGTGNIFSEANETGSSGSVVADVLWTAMEPASGDNEDYTVYFTVTPKPNGTPVHYSIDPKLRVNPT